jgi:hypothetical protein
VKKYNLPVLQKKNVEKSPPERYSVLSKTTTPNILEEKYDSVRPIQ